MKLPIGIACKSLLTPDWNGVASPGPGIVVGGVILVRRLNSEDEVCSPTDGRYSFPRYRHVTDRCRQRPGHVRVGRQRPEVARLAVRPRDR